MKFTWECIENWPEVIAQPRAIILRMEWGQLKISENRKKAIIVLTFRKMKKWCRSVNLISITKKKNTGSSIQTSGWEQGDIKQPMLICQEQITSSNWVFSYDMVTGLCIEKENIFTLEEFLTVSFMTFFSAIQGLPETAIW